MSANLPPSWARALLADVCAPVNKRGPSTDRETFRYIDLGALDNKSKQITEPSAVRVSAAPSRAKQTVKAGDVLFSNVRVYLENIALVPKALEGEIASTAFCVLRPRQGLDPRYLYYYVTSKPFIRAVNALQRGNSPPSVQDDDVRRQLIPIAPSGEQERIASKIDQLFSRIDEAERALERVQKLVERYRQSVLKAAVTGELTREWREKNRDKLESGAALLARILRARCEAWEKAELEKMEAKGLTPANDKWKQKYQEPLPPDTTGLPRLPEGWVWASADQITSLITDGEHATPPRTESGIPLLSARNVRDGCLSLEEIDFVSPETHAKLQERLAIREGDVLLSCSGSVGRTCVVPSGIEFSLVRSVAVLRSPISIGTYISLAIRSPLVRVQIARRKSQTAQANIFQGSIKKLVFPLPSMLEIVEICNVVERQLDESNRISADVRAQRLRVHAQRQSILAKAFAGGLVLQDSTDEAASA